VSKTAPTETDEEYGPTNEYDELADEGWIYGIGAGRRKAIDALEAKDNLNDVDSFNNITELMNAVREMSLALRNGKIYLNPPEKVLDTIEAIYDDLPENAQDEFLDDDIILRRVNAARKAFNRWMDKTKRNKEMPSAMEAGPAKYPQDKADRLRRYAHEGKEELNERLNKVRAAAKGAKSRALEKVGSSVAEHNAEKTKSANKSMREKLSPGSIVFSRDVYRGKAMWGVKRLNKKSVRLKRPSAEKTVDYDSDFLEHIPTEDLDKIDLDETNAEVPEELTEGYDATIRALMGEEWVDDNLDSMPDQENTEDPYENANALSDDDKQEIAKASKSGELKEVFNVIGISTKGPLWHIDWHNTEIKKPVDLVDHYDEHGNFEQVTGIGPAKSEKIERVVPVIRNAIED